WRVSFVRFGRGRIRIRLAWVGFARLGLFLTPKDTNNLLQGTLFFFLHLGGSGFVHLPGGVRRAVGVVLLRACALGLFFLVSTSAKNMREEGTGGRDNSLPAAVQFAVLRWAGARHENLVFRRRATRSRQLERFGIDHSCLHTFRRIEILDVAVTGQCRG